MQQIRRAYAQDIPQMSILMNETFGANPKVEETFRDWMGRENFSVLVAVDSGQKLVALSAGAVQEKFEIQKYETFGANALEFFKNKRVGWIYTMAVLPEFRRQGLAEKLGRSQLAWMKDKRAEVLMGASWDNGTDSNSSHLFKKGRFQVLGESREYIRSQNRQTGRQCSVCSGECQCLTTLYGLII
jgi:ribosomal protein S18 acetylase RimI-like enzyme